MGRNERRPRARGARVHHRVAGREPRFGNWLRALDYMSDRFGLLFSGSLAKAVDAIDGEPFSLSKTSRQDRIRELIQFGLSEPYIGLRRGIGASIDQQRNR